jgi:hypothetical protein
VYPAYLQDLDAQQLEPGEQPAQGSLILERPVHHRLDGLHRSGKAVEIEQGLWRQHPGYPYLVVGRRHGDPRVEIAGQTSGCRIGASRAPSVAGENLSFC